MALTTKEMKTLERLLAKSKVVEVKRLTKSEVARIERTLADEKKAVIVRCSDGSCRVTTTAEYLRSIEHGVKIGAKHAERMRKRADQPVDSTT